jgi:C4-dicarboxylate transporter DctM subunit
MSPILIGLIGLALMLAILFWGVPIGFGMAIVGFAGCVYFTSLEATLTRVVGVIPYTLIANYTFAVLPLFLLMANVCFQSKLGTALFDLVYKWIGRLPGGLAVAGIGASAMFGAVSASTVATTLTIGLVSVPEMRKYNYKPALACATVASSGVLGILIPPSAILILYGIMTEQSIGELFIAGVVPGILLATMFMIMIIVRAAINPAIGPPGSSTSFREKIRALGGSIEILALIVLIIGGLLVGLFTPTEAGAIGAFGAIIFSLIRRRLEWSGFRDAVMETVSGAGMIYLLVIGAYIFNIFLSLSTIPQELANIVAGLALPSAVVMALIVLIYIVLGCFIDSFAMIVLTIPTFYPVALTLGFDPIWFGIVIVMVVGMGGITPPVGMNVYVIAAIVKDVPMGSIFMEVLPFFLVECIFAAILIAVPQLVLWLPRLMQ